jgi:WD40 repeat protein
MAGLVGTTRESGLTPVAAETRGAEDDPRLVYTWEGPGDRRLGAVRLYTPSSGEAPRLVAGLGASLGVWDTRTGAFLQALQGTGHQIAFTNIVTYQEPSDGRPRIAGSNGAQLRIWDGDDFQVLHTLHATIQLRALSCLAVYEEPTSRSTRLVTG